MDEKRDFILREQTRHLYRQNALGFAGSGLCALMIAVLFWEQGNRGYLALWLAALVLVFIARVILQARFRKSSPKGPEVRAWQHRYFWIVGLTGAVWGSIALLLVRDPTLVLHLFVGFVFGGLIAGAVGIYSACFSAFAAFSLPAGIPIAAAFMSHGDRLRVAMGILSTLFLILMTIVVKRLSERFKEILALKFENTELIHELQSEIEVRRAAEERLIGIKEQIEEEVRHLETDLRQAQKMEAIGRLAGGVAHDLNNILSGLVSYPDFLIEEMDRNDPLYAPLDTIRKSGMKAAEIVQDLLTLSRRGISIKEIVNLNDLVSSYLMSIELDTLRKRHPTVQVVSHLASDLENMTGSPVHLQKCLMNLMLNAAEAMPAGGIISIRTFRESAGERMDGRSVGVEISDNGIGMSEAVLEHIFEPFYSRKKLGQSGTGLGMAVVWGTVTDHGGDIAVSSREGEGTTFTLRFPVADGAPSKRPLRQTIDDFVSRNNETILVVDDLPEQRELAQQLLSKLGYEVIVAASGEEAVDRLKASPVDLVILDMVMSPGMDGLDTYKKLLDISPNQRAIITSGYSESDRVKQAQKLGAGAYVRKPYRLNTLARAVREELDRSNTESAA